MLQGPREIQKHPFNLIAFGAADDYIKIAKVWDLLERYSCVLYCRNRGRQSFVFSSVKGRILCTITCGNSVSWLPLGLSSVMSVGSQVFKGAS
jgi:hypothetical protein